MQKIILIGGGGHCKSCIDVIEHSEMYQIAGIIDVKEKLHQKIFGYKIIGTDDDLPYLVDKYKHAMIALGQIKDPSKRIVIFNKVKDLGGTLPVIVSSRAYVSTHAVIGEGTIVMHNALVNAGARIGRNCIINTKALVEHDAIIGDNCHISTGAVVNGDVIVAKNTFVGSNSMVREGIEINEGSVIGGGKIVLRNIT